MTSNSREWGLTILRLWIGFQIFNTGYLKITGGIALSNLLSLQSFSPAAWVGLGILLTYLIGGAAIFLGIAVRLASLLSAIAAAYTIWESSGGRFSGLVDTPHTTSIFIVCLVLIMTGPGRLNLGAAIRNRK